MRLHAPCAVALLFLAVGPAAVKSAPEPEPERIAPLVGYGTVVGLSNTGDTMKNLPPTLRPSGDRPSDEATYERRVAMVVVTAKLPFSAALGQPLDLRLSAIGDATSLAGGSLLATSLVGADGIVYAVGQGVLPPPDAVKPTSARMAAGALVVRRVQ